MMLLHACQIAKIKIWTVRIALTCSLISQLGHAQRGLHIQERQSPNKSPSTGIPGFFDTQLTARNSLVLEAPALTADYGITENLMIGTNLISIFSTLNWLSSRDRANTALLAGKMRYRIFDDAQWSGALTGYAAGSWGHPISEARTEDSQEALYLTILTLNMAREYSGGSFGTSIATAFLGENVTYSNKNHRNSSTLSAQTLSGWWRAAINQFIEAELLAAGCLLIRGRTITPTSRTDTTEICIQQYPAKFFARGLLNWRSSAHWMWSAGAVNLRNQESTTMPFFSVNYSTKLFGQTDD